MPEWLMGADCKSAGYAYAGSNPARPNKRFIRKIALELDSYKAIQFMIFIHPKGPSKTDMNLIFINDLLNIK